MGKASSSIEEIRFDLRDPDITHCYIALRAEGDCPIGVQGWHYKAFPARMSVHEIFADGIEDYMLWPQKSPGC